MQGPVTGMPEVYAGKTGNYSGGLFSAQGDGWETVAKVGDRPLVLRKPLGKGMVYAYLGRWVWQGADALRGVLAYAGRQAAAARAGQARRSTGVCRLPEGPRGLGGVVQSREHRDRLRPPGPGQVALAPPEPLCTTPRGPCAARSSSAWTAWASTLPWITPSTRCWGSMARRWRA